MKLSKLIIKLTKELLKQGVSPEDISQISKNISDKLPDYEGLNKFESDIVNAAMQWLKIDDTNYVRNEISYKDVISFAKLKENKIILGSGDNISKNMEEIPYNKIKLNKPITFNIPDISVISTFIADSLKLDDKEWEKYYEQVDKFETRQYKKIYSDKNYQMWIKEDGDYTTKLEINYRDKLADNITLSRGCNKTTNRDIKADAKYITYNLPEILPIDEFTSIIKYIW